MKTALEQLLLLCENSAYTLFGCVRVEVALARPRTLHHYHINTIDLEMKRTQQQHQRRIENQQIYAKWTMERTLQPTTHDVHIKENPSHNDSYENVSIKCFGYLWFRRAHQKFVEKSLVRPFFSPLNSISHCDALPFSFVVVVYEIWPHQTNTYKSMES